jgi:hypothetical protein
LCELTVIGYPKSDHCPDILSSCSFVVYLATL